MSITMLKKLGANQILGDVKKVVKDHCANDRDVYSAYSIYGVTNGIKTGMSQFGEWTSFLGDLEAVNHVTGEMFTALSCFIPDPLCSIIKGALAENESVEFAFTVQVKRRDDLKEGYEYQVQPHMQTKKSDPLAAIRSIVPPITALNAVKLIEKTSENEEDISNGDPTDQDIDTLADAKKGNKRHK